MPWSTEGGSFVAEPAINVHSFVIGEYLNKSPLLDMDESKPPCQVKKNKHTMMTKTNKSSQLQNTIQ